MRKRKPFLKKYQLCIVLLALVLILFLTGFGINQIFQTRIHNFTGNKTVSNTVTPTSIYDGRPIIPPTHWQPDTTMITPIPLGNQEYIIPELGIKLKLPAEIADLVYVKTSPKTISFSTKSLYTLSHDCVPSEFSLGSFTKINKSEVIKNNPSNWRYDVDKLHEATKEQKYGQFTTPPSVKEFNDFYILYEGPQAACASDDKSVTSLEDAQVRLIWNTVPSIELK